MVKQNRRALQRVTQPVILPVRELLRFVQQIVYLTRIQKQLML